VEFHIDFGHVYTDMSVAIASLPHTPSRFAQKQSCPFHIDIGSFFIFSGLKHLGADVSLASLFYPSAHPLSASVQPSVHICICLLAGGSDPGGRAKTWVCDPSLAGIVGSHPVEGMDGYLL
jgi:hypothetical protein